MGLHHQFVFIQTKFFFLLGVIIGIIFFTACDSSSSSSSSSNEKKTSANVSNTATATTINPNSSTAISSDSPDSCQTSNSIQITDLNLKTCVNDTFFKSNQPATSLGACQIKIMSCPQKNIVSLEGIEFFKNLQQLNLSGNQITDGQPLYSLKQLQILDISNNPLSGKFFVDRWTQLKQLSLQQNILNSIVGLKGLSSLEFLNLANTPLLDCSSIDVLYELKQSSLCGQAADGLRVIDLGFISIDQSVQDQQGQTIYLSALKRFSLPLKGISFEIVAIRNTTVSDTTTACVGNQKTDCLWWESLINPDEKNLLRSNSASPLRSIREHGLVGLSVPMRPEIFMTAGTWQIRLASGSPGQAQLKLVIRQGTLPSQSTLVIQPFLAGTDFSSSAIQGALDQMSLIYQTAGFRVTLKPLISLRETLFNSLSTNVKDPNTSKLLESVTTDAINLFLIPDLFESDIKGLLGVSGGIPGPHGIKDPKNSVLVNIAAHEIQGTVSENLLGETMAHEIGHWLGLFHTTEDDGLEFDILEDTSECLLQNDRADVFGRRDQTLSAEECATLDGHNLMFWSPGENIIQTTLTKDQIYVLKHAPIVQ